MSQQSIAISPAYVPALRDGSGSVATHSVMAAFIAASGNESAWVEGFRSRSYTQVFKKPGEPGSAHILLTAPGVERERDIFSADSDEPPSLVSALAGIDLDVVRWLDARFAANGLVGKDDIRILVDAVDYYRDRGILKRGGSGVKKAYRDAFDAAIERLGALRIAGYVYHRGKGNGDNHSPVIRAPFGRESPAQTPEHEYLIRGEGVPFLDATRQERGWAVALGTWYGTMHRAFPRQRVRSKLFTLDDRGGRLAKRIGAYIEIAAFMNSRRDVFERRVSTMLEGAGVVRSCDERPARFRARVERALETLKDVGLITEWAYRDGSPDTSSWLSAVVNLHTCVPDTESGPDTETDA